MANFEIASREKYRFPWNGLISVEDLWDLSAVQLDRIYKTLNKGRKEIQEESLLEVSRNKEDETLENMIDIVRYIFNAKKEEEKERKEVAAKRAKKERIKEIIAEKQDASLANLSIEELQRLLEE